MIMVIYQMLLVEFGMRQISTIMRGREINTVSIGQMMV